MKSLPEERQKLGDDARQTLTQEQGEKFQQLKLDYRETFSTNDDTLGQTDGTHLWKWIQSQRLVKSVLKEEATREEQRMKQLGVIEPSEFPWAALVVLVRTMD